MCAIYIHDTSTKTNVSIQNRGVDDRWEIVLWYITFMHILWWNEKVLRFLRKSLNVNCFCLIITYFYVLIFQFLKKWTFRIQHISSLTKMNGLQHSSFFSGKRIINDIYLCFLNHDETFLIFWYTKCLLWNCSEFVLVNYVTE